MTTTAPSNSAAAWAAASGSASMSSRLFSSNCAISPACGVMTLRPSQDRTSRAWGRRPHNAAASSTNEEDDAPAQSAAVKEPVEHAEFLLPQTLVDGKRTGIVAQAPRGADEHRRALCPAIGRGEDDLGTVRGRHRGEPAPQGMGLAFPEGTQGNVDVPFFDRDMRRSRSYRRIPGDVAGAFAVAHDPDPTRPSLRHTAPSATCRANASFR